MRRGKEASYATPISAQTALHDRLGPPRAMKCSKWWGLGCYMQNQGGHRSVTEVTDIGDIGDRSVTV